jgi:D-glycero-alpha-D-manno-heptose-7-phosphate kinase
MTNHTKYVQNKAVKTIADNVSLLHEQWQLKRGMSAEVTNAEIDRIYEVGLRAGATGGKLLGAGGGGFMLFFVEPERRLRVLEAMSGLLHVPVRFDFLGSQIVYFSKDDYY